MTFSFVRPSPIQLARYLLGIVVVSVGATFGIQSAVGASPYDALIVTLSERVGVPFWATAWILQGVWITLIIAAGGRISFTTLLHSLSFGPIMNLALQVVPVASSPWLSVLYLAVAVLGMALGIWLYLGSGFVQGMVDTLFETVSRRAGWKASGLRTVFDVTCCAVAWIGAGPVGIGTVVSALGVGPILTMMDGGLLRPASWRGIPLGRARRPEALELVDTTEYRILSSGLSTD